MDDEAFLCPPVGGESRWAEATLMFMAAAAGWADVGSGVGVALGVHPLSRLDALSLSPCSELRGGEDSGGADAGLARALDTLRPAGAAAGPPATGEEERL